MRIGIVVQRYGNEINGGAELHARLVAEQLAQRHSVEVFTTCARDYVTWKNEYPKGDCQINGILVHRFRVKHQRVLRRFEDVQNLVFHESQSIELEERWIKENGPYCPKIVKAVQNRPDINVWILFSYRYWTTVQCLRVLGGKAILVPTAEHDPALYLKIFKPLFNLPGAIAYNSVEEKQLIEGIASNQSIPGQIVGVGLVSDYEPDMKISSEFQAKYKEKIPYLIYVGRIDKNKGCDHLFRMFLRFCREEKTDLKLLLIGSTVIPVPDHPSIQHLGFVSESEKLAAIKLSRILMMPSQYESLSMVLLEAWSLGKPALVNGKCEVLEGQCRRSNGGLIYKGYDEFAESLKLFEQSDNLCSALGHQGNDYYNRNYRWDHIINKYDQLLAIIERSLH